LISAAEVRGRFGSSSIWSFVLDYQKSSTSYVFDGEVLLASMTVRGMSAHEVERGADARAALEGAVALAADVDASRVAIAVIRPATSGRRLSATADNSAACLVGFVISAPESDLDEIRLRLEATNGHPIDAGAADMSLQGVETLDEAPSYFTLPGSLLHAAPAGAVATDAVPIDADGSEDDADKAPRIASDEMERLVVPLAAVSAALCIIACAFRACAKKRGASVRTVRIVGPQQSVELAPTTFHPDPHHQKTCSSKGDK